MLTMKISEKTREEVKRILKELNEEGPYEINKKFIQHGRQTVHNHCVSVAVMCCTLAEKFHLPVKRNDLIRGALLHDFFLYDWHEPVLAHKIHGYTHPKKAMKNAEQFYGINKREKRMIRHHMFPLTPHPPTNLEAWVLCISDKICAIQEMKKAKRTGVYEAIKAAKAGAKEKARNAAREARAIARERRRERKAS